MSAMFLSLIVPRIFLLLLAVATHATSTPTSTAGTPNDVNTTADGDVSEEDERPLSEELAQLRDELRQGLGQLKHEIMSKNNMATTSQSALYNQPAHFHHFFHHSRPALYPSNAGPPADEMSALRQLLQVTEDRLQATEYRLQTAESRLQGTESDLQNTKNKLHVLQDRLETDPHEPQGTQSRPRSCEDKLTATQQRLQSAESKLNLLDQTALSVQNVDGQGSIFVRWGKNQCPNSTQLIYTGLAGGSWFEHKGGAANRLCLTTRPEYDDTAAPGPLNYLHGVEYQHLPGHHDHDVPCCVCRAPQSTTIMVPATLTCPPGWLAQYSGHLVAAYHGHEGAGEYLCLDSEPENRPGGHVNNNGALFYYAVTKCGSLPCPPYQDGKVATCVVCSL